MRLSFNVPSFIKPALYNDHKYSIISAGRRVGKTYNSIQWLLESLLTDPNARYGLHVDTTQANLTTYVERYYKPLLKPIWHLCKWNGQQYKLKLPGNKVIDFGSSQKPENLEGFEYDYAVLNEAGIILHKDSLWEESLEPMFHHAQVRIIGTPKSKNLFHKMWVRGQSDDDNYKSFQFSSYDSPFVSDKVINEAKKSLPEAVFNQNYLAHFVEGEGTVFRNIHRLAHNNIIEVGDPNKSYVMSADIAKHTDFTVVMIGDLDTKEVLFMDRFNKIDYEFQIQRIVNIWEKFHRPQFIMDSTGVGDALFDRLSQAGMNIEGFKFTNSSKSQIINGLSLSMDNSDIHIANYPVLLSELEVFEYDITRSGNITYNAPPGLHDDCVIALALLNKLFTQTQPFQLFTFDLDAENFETF